MESYKKLKLFVLTVFCSVTLSSSSLFALADWTVLVFVQAKNNLNKFAIKNLSDMASIGSNSNLNILVQWYQPNQKGVWRYKINKNKIDLDTFLPYDTDGTCVSDLVDSMQWAVSNHPAKKYFLVLWNHGVGIGGSSTLSADPIVFDQAEIADNPRVQIDGITKGLQDLLEKDYSTLKADLSSHRGILFNEYNRTYMNNQELAEALRQIKTNVLKNKKIDVLGMDACLMAMVEVGYQIKDFANYMVASQEVELAHGWDYLTLMQGLTYGRVNPVQLAQSIVLTYENFYQGKINFYTQSAINLENMSHIKDSIDTVVDCLNNCKKYDKAGIKELVKAARKSSLQFSTKSYIDLYSFYYQMLRQLENDNQKDTGFLETRKSKKQNKNNINASKKTNSLSYKKAVKDLKQALDLSMKVIEGSVIANVAGKKLATARGLSIYFPQGKVDSSYDRTEFAKNSSWLSFIEDAIE